LVVFLNPMFNFLQKDSIIDTDDLGLRYLIHEHLKIFAKFTAEDCVICKLLGPGFAKFSDGKEYQGIQFVRLESGQNAVAKQLMRVRNPRNRCRCASAARPPAGSRTALSLKKWRLG